VTLCSNTTAAESEALADAVELMGRQFDTLVRGALKPMIPLMTTAVEKIGLFLEGVRSTDVLQNFSTGVVGIAVKMLGLTKEVQAFSDAIKVAEEGGKTQLQIYNEASDAATAQAAKVDRLTYTYKQNAKLGLDNTIQLEKLTEARRELQTLTAFATAEERLLAIEMETVAANAAAADARLRQLAITEKTLGRFGQGDGAVGPAKEADDVEEAEERKREARRESNRELAASLAEEADQTAATLARGRQAREDAHHASMRLIDDERRARASAAAGWLSAAASAASGVASIVNEVTSITISQTQRGSLAQRKALKEAHEAQSAAAVFQAAINVPLAISNAIGTAPNPIVGAILGVIAGAAAGAALAATVAKAANKPKFHSGGVASAYGMNSAREVPATLLPGEGVVTAPTVRRMGGAAGLAAMERGEHAGQGRVTVALQMGNRTVDVQQRAALKRSNSPLSSALRATQPRRLGRHNPFGG
jgi:hypothetical protein